MADQEAMENDAEFHEEEAEVEAAPPSPPPQRASEYAAPEAREREARYAAMPPESRRANPQARMPFLAAFFSIFPGVGNIYNGLYMRGITFFVIIIGLIGLAASADNEAEGVPLVFTVIFVWLFNLFDAYRQATLINFGHTPDVELARPKIPAWGSGGMVAGVVVFVLGLYGFLRETFHIDLSLLADYWYVLFMAFGAFLIFRSWSERNQAEASGGLGAI